MNDPKTIEQVVVRAGDIWRIRIPMCEPPHKQQPKDMVVLAVVDGYAMVQIIGGFPWVHEINKWKPEWELHACP